MHAYRPETFTVVELCGIFSKSKLAYYKHDFDIDLHRMSLEEFAVQFIRGGKAKDHGINNTLKNELFKDMDFSDIGQVRDALHKTVMFYNHELPHLSLEIRTPAKTAT